MEGVGYLVWLVCKVVGGFLLFGFCFYYEISE